MDNDATVAEVAAIMMRHRKRWLAGVVSRRDAVEDVRDEVADVIAMKAAREAICKVFDDFFDQPPLTMEQREQAMIDAGLAGMGKG